MGVMMGRGKYDAMCTYVRVNAEAKAAIVVILGGNRGSGFSVQSTDAEFPADGKSLAEWLPKMLRHIADTIERDLAAGGIEDMPPSR
jgi:hypothetical protein